MIPSQLNLEVLYLCLNGQIPRIRIEMDDHRWEFKGHWKGGLNGQIPRIRIEITFPRNLFDPSSPVSTARFLELGLKYPDTDAMKVIMPIRLNGQIPRIRIEIQKRREEKKKKKEGLNGQIPRIRIEIAGLPAEEKEHELQSQRLDSQNQD